MKEDDFLSCTISNSSYYYSFLTHCRPKVNVLLIFLGKDFMKKKSTVPFGNKEDECKSSLSSNEAGNSCSAVLANFCLVEYGRSW